MMLSQPNQATIDDNEAGLVPAFLFSQAPLNQDDQMAEAASTVRARFYADAIENPKRSKEAGRPMFDDVEMVEFLFLDDRNTRFVAPADERSRGNGPTYAERYPREYEAFKRGAARAATGTPLEHWPILTTSRVHELKALGILSVDELADASEGIIRNIGRDGRTLQEQARAFIGTAKDGAGTAAMAAELQKLRAQVEALSMASAPAPMPAAMPEPEPESVDINDASDEQLKRFIKDRTGEAPRGKISRDTLMKRVSDLAEQEAA
jgi:hypothetical protein